MSFLKSVQSIAYLGPGGSYTEMAKDIFCEKYEIDLYNQRHFLTYRVY